jgi:hypothetical protein
LTTESVTWLLWAWALLSPLLFRFLPGRDAASICLIVGWGFLPVAPYPASSLVEAGKNSSLHALVVPTSLLVNKATAIGLGCLLGLLLFDRRTFERLKLDRVDLPMVVWCVVPLASSWANGLPLSEGLAQCRYLGLTWAVPYLMGRAYLTDVEAQGRFVVILAAAGLAYLPICLLEIVTGPMVYRAFYGAHPYEFEGAIRALGHRPLGFLEHGNQLGIWMASSALGATWIWATGAVKKPGGVPGGILAGLLIAITVLSQSHASIILLGLGVLPLGVQKFSGRWFSWRIGLGLILGLSCVLLLLEAGRRGFQPDAIRADVAAFFRGMNKTSFTWRLARTEEFLPDALQRPWLGWARPDWRPGSLPFFNPVNLPIELLAFGMYGLIGGSAILAIWIVPLIRGFGPRPSMLLGRGFGARGALVALVAINALDSLSNSTVLLPLLAAIGGLNRPWVER